MVVQITQLFLYYKKKKFIFLSIEDEGVIYVELIPIKIIHLFSTIYVIYKK